MACIHLDGGVVCVADGEYTILVGRQRYRFEWHRFFGPTPISKKDGSVRNLKPNHPFWAAVGEWVRGGKRIGADGFCEW